MTRLPSFRIFCALIACATVAFAAPGDAPSMDPDSSKSSPFGLNPLSKERPKDAKTEITAKIQASFDNNANTAEFEGNVVVQDPQFTLFCDKLKVTLNKDRKGLASAEAIGNVIITQETKDDSGKVTRSIGRGGKALFQPSSGDITISIWPSVQHDINMQVATEAGTVMILNRSGKSRTLGASKTVIVDSSKQSY